MEIHNDTDNNILKLITNTLTDNFYIAYFSYLNFCIESMIHTGKKM